MWRRKSIHRYKKSLVLLGIAPLGIVLLVLVLLTGCAGTPSVPMQGSWFYSLPPGQDIYGKVKARNLVPLIESIDIDGIPGNGGISDFLDMTEEVYFSTDAELKNFSLIAVGEYPTVILRSVIANSEEWYKGSGEIEHWVYRDEGPAQAVQIAFPAYNVVCISRGMISDLTLVRLQEKRIHPPEDMEYAEAFLLHQLINDFSILLSNPHRSFGEELPIDQTRFPVNSVWFTTSREGNEYVSSFTFVPKEPKKAKTLATFMKLMLAGWMRKEDIGDVSTLSKTAYLEVEDERVTLGGIYFSAEDIKKLLTIYGSGASK